MNLKIGIFPLHPTEGIGCPNMLHSCPLDIAKRLIMLTPKQIYQRLPIVLS